MTPLPPEIEALATRVSAFLRKDGAVRTTEYLCLSPDECETLSSLCALARQGSEDAARAEPTRTEPPLCYCGHPESHHVPMSLGSIVGGWHGCVSCLEAKTHCEMFDAARSTP